MLVYPARPASTWQSRDDRMRAVARAYQPKVARALKKALTHFASLTPTDRIAGLLRQGRTRDAIALIPFERLADSIRHAFDLIAQAYEAGGREGADALNRRLQGRRRAVQKAPGSVYAFDRFTDAVVSQLLGLQNDLISALTDQSRAVVADIILQGVQRDSPQEQVALAIRNAVGLTARQAQAVESFRRSLLLRDGKALQRRLRETFFDEELRRIRAGVENNPLMIDLMVDAYAERQRQFRAETIAQTETLRAANLGLHESYKQMVRRGAIPHSAIVRSWKTAMDERMCPVCAPIPEMNPRGVQVGAAFRTPDGPQMDPPLHPRCRCTVEYETDLEFFDVGEIPGAGAGI